MAGGPLRIPHWWNGLRVRLAILLTVALLPIGLIAIWQTEQVADTASQTNEQALIALTETAAQQERLAMERAFGAARLLSKIAKELLEDPQTCRAYLDRFVDGENDISYIALLPRSGILTCSSTGDPADILRLTNLPEIMDAAQPRVEVSSVAQFTSSAPLVVFQPYSIDGTFAGYVTAAIPHSAVTNRLRDLGLPFRGLRDIIAYTPNGDLLTANDADQTRALLPPDRSLQEVMTSDKVAFTATAQNGERFAYTVVRIRDTPITILGIWQNEQLVSGTWWDRLPPYLFPGLMWLASLAVAMLALNTLVIRHITSLKKSMDRFAVDRAIGAMPDTDDMPNEIAALQHRFYEMTDDILREEAHMEAMLREKNVLLKEVHHRVKNNLQMIASIINFQIRSVDDKSTVPFLQKIQDRIANLVSVYRELYTAPDGGRVDVGKLIETTTKHTLGMSDLSVEEIKPEYDIDRVLLFPDQAVAMSLLASEVINNAVKYLGRADGAPALLRVRLKEVIEGTCLFEIENDTVSKTDADSKGVGSKLIRAFAIKLGGTITQDNQGDRHTFALKFPIAAFEAAAVDY